MTTHSDDESIRSSSQSSQYEAAHDQKQNQDNGSATGSSHGSSSPEEKLNMSKSRYVTFLRLGVVLVLLLAASAVSIVVFVSDSYWVEGSLTCKETYARLD